MQNNAHVGNVFKQSEEEAIQSHLLELKVGAQAKKMWKPEHGNELEKFKATLEMLLPRTTMKTIIEEEKTKGVHLERERASMPEVSKI